MAIVNLRVVGEGVSTREILDGTKIRDIFSRAGSYNFQVNGNEASLDTPLRAGDNVDIIPTYKNG